MLIGILKNLVILLLIIAVLFAVTKFVPTVSKQTEGKIANVLGAKTTATDEGKPLADSLKKDTEEQLSQAKEKALHINVADVLKTIDRLQKIPRDISSLQKGITDTFSSFTKRK